GNTANTNEGGGGLGNGGGILNSDNGMLVMTDGAITGNFAARAGGGIENNLGTLTLNNVAITGNAAGINGGALHISGAATVSISGGSVTNNAAGNEGGGLWNSASGTLTVNAVTVGGNTATTGAGIFNDGAGGTITLTNSTVSTNIATGLGGGISSEGGGLVITNSTISANQSSSTGGGGIYILDGTADISNSTIAANVGNAGGTGGLEQAGGSVTLVSTLIADNLSGAAPSDIFRGSGTLNASSSLIELLPVGAINGTDAQNQSGVDPVLGPLQNNGGPTQTHALTIGSPAVNKGSNPLGLPFDQRGIGFTRTFGSQSDIGAYELSFPNIFASGSGKGGKGLVSIYDSKTGLAINEFYPFGKKFKGGVTVATGDINGDDSPDVVTAKEKSKPKLKVFDAISGAEIGSFTAFKKGKGTNLAVADIDGDGTGDIIAGIAKGKTQVAIFSGTGLPIGAPITPFDSKFKGGSTVAAGDVNGDGVPDIIVGQASKGASVQVFDGVTRSPIADFLAFDGGFTSGVYVASGDVNGDGTADIIAGAGKGQPIVRVFDGITGTLIQGPVADFAALNPAFKGGVRVAATDFNGDGIADIIAGSGKKDKPPTIRVISSATGSTIYEFTPKDASKKGGVFVG
ncbi:MAG: choice-of-anchor Q domain-containing protein, partial [Chthoniobacteraceae bacterium]